jgi:hypothetical protein
MEGTDFTLVVPLRILLLQVLHTIYQAELAVEELLVLVVTVTRVQHFQIKT